MMLRPCGLLLQAMARPPPPASRRGRPPQTKLRPDEAANYKTFLHGVMQEAYSEDVLRAYKQNVGTTGGRFRGRLAPNPGSLVRVLSMEHEVPSPAALLKKLVKFLDHVENQQCTLDEGVVVAFLSAYVARVRAAKRRDIMCVVGTRTHALLQEMHGMFQWCRVNGHEVERQAWTIMVQAASVAKFSTLVRYLCREMQRCGVTPDVFVASMVISSFRATSSTKTEVVDELRRETIRAWMELKSLGIVPDAHCYAAMIATLNSFGDNMHAEQIYQQMLDMGHRPTVRVYTALLTGASSPEKLQKIIRDMAEQKIKIDIAAFTAVMGTMRRLYPGDYAQAEAVFHAAVRERVVLDEWAFCGLLLVYRDARNVKKAASLMVDMINTYGIRPSHSSVNLVLETASLTAREPGDPGSQVAEWMWRYCTLHNVHTHHSYGFMMKAMLAANKPDFVVSLFSSLKQMNYQVSLQHFEHLIAAYSQLNNTAAIDAIKRLPRYKQLVADYEGMQASRLAKKARPLAGFLRDYGKEDTGSSTAQKETKAPLPKPKRDAVGLQLAAVADRLESSPDTKGEDKKTKVRYAIDDVLGI